MKLKVMVSDEGRDLTVIRQLVYRKVNAAVQRLQHQCDHIAVYLEDCEPYSTTQRCRIQLAMTPVSSFEVSATSDSIVDSIFEATKMLEQAINPVTVSVRCL